MIREVDHHGDELVEVHAHECTELHTNLLATLLPQLEREILDTETTRLGVGEVVEAAWQGLLGRVEPLEHHSPVQPLIDRGVGLCSYLELAFFSALEVETELEGDLADTERGSELDIAHLELPPWHAS